MEIRTLTREDDLCAVGEVYARSWKHSYRGLLPQPFLDKLTSDRWSAMLSAAPHMTLALWEEDTPIGAATLGFCRGECREGWGEIISLYLLPEAMGFGHGRRLLEAALEQLRQEGCEQACLWVFSWNEYAVHFYEHMGFVRTGRTQYETYASQSVELTEMTCAL